MKRAKKISIGFIGLVLVWSQFACRLAILGLQDSVPLVPTPTNTQIITRTFTPTATRTPTSTPIPTDTPIPTSTPTAFFLAAQSTEIPPGLEPISLNNAGKVSALAEWHETSVSDMEWIPDGAVLAVANQFNINLYQIETREILRTLYPTKEGLVDIAFSPDGAWLISGSRQGDEKQGFSSSLDLWAGPNWKPLGLLYGELNGLNELVFTPEGDYLAAVYSRSSSQRGYVDFWHTSTWTINTTMDTGTILQVAISPDSAFLATSPDRYDIRVWDLQQHTFLYRLPTSFTGAVNRLVFSPESKFLAAGHYDGMIRLWDVENGDLLLEFDTGAVVESLAFSPDGQVIASGGAFENSLIQLWSSGSGVLLRSLENQSGGISELSFSPNSKYLVSASYDGTLRVWGIRP